ncbi:hypothetical protein B0H12DRAFT_1159878 [Mycena haematopus]|nr:hypothetical protein B0H12DRAFT_1159878 [Mycena haematopus]
MKAWNKNAKQKYSAGVARKKKKIWANRYNARHWLMEAPAPPPILRVTRRWRVRRVRRVHGGGCTAEGRRRRVATFFEAQLRSGWARDDTGECGLRSGNQ